MPSLVQSLHTSAVALTLATAAHAHVTLVAPNGGEALPVGTTFDITWSLTVPHNTLDWDLWYSSTGPAGPWVPIALDLPLGNPNIGSIHTYTWTVPSAVSGDVFVRVRQDNTDLDYEDQSDAALAISMGEAYCAAVPNTTGAPAAIAVSGSNVALDADVTLTASALPPLEFGYFLASRSRALVMAPGGSVGNLCLGGNVARFSAFVLDSGAAGEFSLAIDTTSIPTSPPAPVLAGETWHFQAWFRDHDPVATSNFTHGISVVFN